MMRRLVQRHRGILPLDTVESIWRVIISTFTYVQARFRSMPTSRSANPRCRIRRDSFRLHVPYVSHFSATAAVEAVAKSKGDLALVAGVQAHPMVDRARGPGAPKIIARLPSSNAPTIRRRCRYSWCRALPTAPCDRSRDVERAGVGLERRSREPCRRWRKSSPCRTPPSTAPPCWCRWRSNQS